MSHVVLQAEEAIARRFDALRERRPAAAPSCEVGLILGKRRAGGGGGGGGGRADLALACVPTPPLPDGGGPAIAVRVAGADGGAGASSGGGGGGKRGGGGGAAGAGGGAGASSSQQSSQNKQNPPLSSLALDADWTAEHARQVARMLPGGLSVLGLYVFCPDGAFSAAGAPALRAAAAALAGALALPAREARAVLLLHGDCSPSAARQHSLRAVDVSGGASVAAAEAASAAAPLRPADLKFGPSWAGGQLVALRCRHAFDISAAVAGGVAAGTAAAAAATDAAPPLHAALQAAAESEARRVARSCGAAAIGRGPSGAYATALPLPASSAPGEEEETDEEDEAVAAAAGGGSGSHRGGGGAPTIGDWLSACAPAAEAADGDVPCWDVSLLLPPSGSAEAAAAAAADGSASGRGSTPAHGGGAVRLSGAVFGLAYAHRREPAASALQSLREDVARSLRARAELAQEEALAAEAAAAEEEEEEAAAAAPAAAAAAAQGGDAGKRKRRQKPRLAHPLLALAGAAATAPTRERLARRVLVPWSPLGGPEEGAPAPALLLRLSDLVCAGEAPAAAAARAAGMFFGGGDGGRDGAGEGWDDAAVEEVEGEAAAKGGEPSRDAAAAVVAAAAAAAVAVAPPPAHPLAPGCGGTAVAAAAAAALAVAVGCLAVGFGS